MPNPKPIHVVAAIIRQGERYLITRRRLDAKNEPGRWEFPGGKVEPGEAPEAALAREIKEELGIIVSVQGLYAESSYKTIHLSAYSSKILSGNIQHIGCMDSAWVAPEDMERYDFSEADKPIVAMLALADGNKAASSDDDG